MLHFSFLLPCSQSFKHFNVCLKFTCQFRKCPADSWGFVGYSALQRLSPLSCLTASHARNASVKLGPRLAVLPTWAVNLRLDSVYLMACHFSVEKVLKFCSQLPCQAVVTRKRGEKCTKILCASLLHLY